MPTIFAAIVTLSTIAAPSAGPEAPRYFTDCPHRTGAAATVIVPASAQIKTAAGGLKVGDELAVLAPDGSCAGAAVWSGEGIAVTVWEDDPFTPVLEGLLPGDPLEFAAYDASAGVAYETVSVDYDRTYASEGVYTRGDLYVLNSDGVGIEEGLGEGAFALEQNYPNPVRSETTVAFSLETAGDVRLEVYDALGRLVAVPAVGDYGPGRHTAYLDAANMAPGVYVCRLTVDGTAQQRAFTVAR